MTATPDQMAGLADEATALLKAFAHPARLMICCQLKEEELSVGEIERRLDIRQPRLSRELSKLREEGLVETRREAKNIYYRLTSTPRVRHMMEAICAVMLGKEVSAPLHVSHDDARPRENSGGYGVFARPIPAPTDRGASS